MKEIITEEKFKAYTRVQKIGLYNMLDPRAQEMTGLDDYEYGEIISNYDKYYNKYYKENNCLLYTSPSPRDS